MEVFARPAFTRVAGLIGSVISVALVLGASVASAGSYRGYPSVDEAAPDLIEDFSNADLEQLEHASAAEVTVARLAAMMDAVKTAKKRRPSLASDAVAEVAPVEDADLFPHSGRLLPLLTVRPEAPSPVVRTVAPMRPGLVQPVGIPRSTIRRVATGQGSR